MRNNMIFFITNAPNSVPNRESETAMKEVQYIPLGDIWPQNLSKETQQAIRLTGYLADLKPDHPAFTQDTNSYTIFAQTRRRTCPTPELKYHWDKTRRFLEEVLHMKSVDIFPVAHWAWQTSLWIKGAKDDWTRQMHERSGVLVAPDDGTVIGYTTCVPVNPVNLASGEQWSESILRPDTSEAYGLDADKPIPVGNGYWFVHPAIMYGQQIAHVRYVNVGMGDAVNS
jgi:hypothetical protein